MPEIGIKEFLRLLQTYTKNFSMENEVLSALCSQAINLKNEFSDFQLQLTFQCLTSMHAEPSFINQLDNVIFEKIEGMNIWNLAQFSFIYGKYYSTELYKPGIKHNIMKKIEHHFYTNRPALTENLHIDNVEFLISKLMWGLACGNVINILKLWRDFGNEINQNKNYSKSENAKFIDLIRKILLIHSL